MRFCMVTTFYPPCSYGGDGVYVRALATELTRRGHEVEVIHCADAYRLGGGTATPVDEDAGVRVHALASRFGSLSPLLTQQTGHPVLKKRALAAILDRGFDVIHFHNISLIGGPGVLGLGDARLRLYTPHDYWPLCTAHVFWKNRTRSCDGPQCIRCALRSRIPPQAWRATRLLERGFEAVNAILAPSRHCARRYELAALGPEIRLLPLFADMQPPGKPAEGDDGFFLYAGRLEKLKGVDFLLEIFGGLNATLRLAGEGELKQRAEQHDGVHVAGRLPRDELASLMNRAAAVIAPSRAPETFGLSVVEAYACQTPVIVSDRGALPELVRGSDAGFVCATADEFRGAITRLQQDGELRARMGRNGRRIYESAYTPGRHMDAYLELVEDMLSERYE